MDHINEKHFSFPPKNPPYTAFYRLRILRFILLYFLFVFCFGLETTFARGVLMVVSQGWHSADQAFPIEYTSVKPFGAVWNVVDAEGKSRRINSGLIIADIWLPTMADYRNIESSSEIQEIQNKLAEIESFKTQYPKSASKLAPAISLLSSLLSMANKQVRVNGVWLNREARNAQIKEQKDQEIRAQNELAEKTRLEEKAQKEYEAKIAEQKAQEDKLREREKAKLGNESYRTAGGDADGKGRASGGYSSTHETPSDIVVISEERLRIARNKMKTGAKMEWADVNAVVDAIHGFFNESALNGTSQSEAYNTKKRMFDLAKSNWLYKIQDAPDSEKIKGDKALVAGAFNLLDRNSQTNSHDEAFDSVQQAIKNGAFPRIGMSLEECVVRYPIWPDASIKIPYNDLQFVRATSLILRYGYIKQVFRCGDFIAAIYFNRDEIAQRIEYSYYKEGIVDYLMLVEIIQKYNGPKLIWEKFVEAESGGLISSGFDIKGEKPKRIAIIAVPPARDGIDVIFDKLTLEVEN